MVLSLWYNIFLQKLYFLLSWKWLFLTQIDFLFILINEFFYAYTKPTKNYTHYVQE